ncbi:MAG: hypothetical protein ACPLRN_00390 [Microgenomates group bacterium]
MNKKKFITVFIIFFLLPFQLAYLYFTADTQSPNSQVAGIKTNLSPIINSLAIGEFKFTLYGYTSPGALVNLNGLTIVDQVWADNQGYFEFRDRYLPVNQAEACLSAKDQFGRVSSPVCLPPFPNRSNLVIGPIILPPTLSLDKSVYYVGDEVILTGQSLPNTDVSLSLFNQSSSSKLAKIFQLIKPVEAFGLPKIFAKTDAKGNFSLSIPASQAQNFRLFAQANYQNTTSPASIQLSLKILPVWMIIFQFFGFIWSLIKDRLLEVVIFLEIVGLILYFLEVLIKQATNHREIVLYRLNLPVLIDKKD